MVGLFVKHSNHPKMAAGVQESTQNKDSHMSTESKTSLRGRDAKSGEFRTVDYARKHPETAVVERVPKPGHGDTKPDPKKDK
jgi:hypothetical protein